MPPTQSPIADPMHVTAKKPAFHRAYLAATLVATAIAVVGFWPTYFGPLLSGTVNESPLIHVHGVVYIGWLALFIAQVALAGTGRVALHMKLGRWLMAYGVVVVAAGLLAAWHGFGAVLEAEGATRAQTWVFGVLRELLFFVPFFAAGWIYRRRPEIHKRLMIVALTMLIVPAIGRMGFLGPPVPLWKFMAVWPLPVYVAMVHDFSTRRIVHPVYVIGIVAMLAQRVVLPLRNTETWQTIAAKITSLYVALH
jgi:hypothetical protein